MEVLRFLIEWGQNEAVEFKITIQNLKLQLLLCNTVKPVLSGHSKIDEIKVLKTSGSLMQV